MYPSLALLLCTAFVLFLLWIERRASRRVSPALWIPTLWMLIIASRPLASWFLVPSSIALDNDSGSALDRWVLISLAVAAIVVLARRKFNWAEALLRQKWMMVLLLYMLLSTLWSDTTLIALRRWVHELIVVPMAFLVASEADPRQALASIPRRCAYILLPSSLMLIKYYPLLGREYGRWTGIEMWTGVTTQKNHLGLLCVVSIIFVGWALYQSSRERRHGGRHYQVWADVFIILLAVYLLHAANSATSLVSLIAGIVVYLGLQWLRKLRLKVAQSALIMLVLFLMAYGTSAPFLGGANVAEFSSTLGRDSTLTGRTHLWAALLPAHERQPALGYGVGSFWTDARRQLYDAPTAHNGYLDILLELGQLGLAFYAVWLLSLAQQLHRALRDDYESASLAICLLLMGLIYNVTESTLNSMTEYMTSALILTALLVDYKPFVASNRINSQTALLSNTAASLGTAADWQTGKTCPELTGNS